MSIKKCFSLFLALFLLTSLVRADDMIVETAPLTGSVAPVYGTNPVGNATFGSGIDLNANYLPRGTRSVDSAAINAWAEQQGIYKGESLADPCTWQTFFLFLWRMSGSPAMADTSLFLESDPESYKEREHSLAWAVSEGLTNQISGRQMGLYSMTHGNAQWALWHLAGEPAPMAKAHKLPEGVHDIYELWACDVGLIVYEEQPFSDPNAMLNVQEALTYLYYIENRRFENSFRITVDEFLNSCQRVVDTARTYGYVYGSSTAVDPTTDGKISCDRLIAKALYDLGYTDQPAGGITCGNADEYLYAWGFERSTDMSAIRRGSILLVKHTWSGHTDHMFVAASDFNFSTMSCDRYDCGSMMAIGSVQPLYNKPFQYKTNDLIVYNIPA